MIRYFCECCGKEMDNTISRQLRWMVKSKEEFEGDSYSVCDDTINVCEDCYLKVQTFIKDGCSTNAEPKIRYSHPTPCEVLPPIVETEERPSWLCRAVGKFIGGVMFYATLPIYIICKK